MLKPPNGIFSCLQILAVCLLFSTQAAADNLSAELILVDANPDAGFAYPYILRLPKSKPDSVKNYLIVETNNSGLSDDLDRHIQKSKSQALGQGPGPMMASDLKMPFLMPVFPRSKTDYLVYTHALDRDAMLINSGPSKRLDLQLLKMVEDAQTRLRAIEIEVQEKFVLVGFSASGTFSNRFAFLHPGSLLAVVSGAVNSMPMLPVSRVSEAALSYPLGLDDFAQISGKEFELSNWLGLAQMIYMGALDDNDAVKFNDAYSEDERAIVFSAIGEKMSERWLESQSIYLAKQPNVTFMTYGQVGHWTDGRIRRDMSNFIKTAIDKDIRRILGKAKRVGASVAE
jgi:hypothetical protein